MTEVKDGGPAMPCSNEQYTHGNPQAGDAWSGMSLRDWFAGQALAGLCANVAWNGLGSSGIKVRAIDAYSIADAMLSARKEPE